MLKPKNMYRSAMIMLLTSCFYWQVALSTTPATTLDGKALIMGAYAKVDSILDHALSDQQLQIEYAIITHYASEGQAKEAREAVSLELSNLSYHMKSANVEIFQDTTMKVILYPESKELLVQEIEGPIEFGMFSQAQLAKVLETATVTGIEMEQSIAKIELSLPPELASAHGIDQYVFWIDTEHALQQRMEVHFAAGAEASKIVFDYQRFELSPCSAVSGIWVKDKFFDEASALKGAFADHTVNYVTR